MKIFQKQNKLFLCTGIILAAAAFFFLILRFSPYRAKTEFMSRGISTRIYDGAGELVQIMPLKDGLRREFIPLEKMPAALPEIFIFSEDKNFYRHHGVDFPAILRAAFQNIKSGRTVSGASTITMQLARIIKPRKRRNVFSKMLEAFDALRLESRLDKKEILELYLNSIPFGFNAEGVASAARAFFSRPVTELSLEEIFCLAVIPRRPQLYSPIENPDANARAAFELYEAYKNFQKASDGIKKHFALKKNESAESYSLSKADFVTAAAGANAFVYPNEFPHYVRFLAGEPKSGIYSKPQIQIAARLKLQHTAEALLNEAVAQNRDKRITNGAVLIADTQTGKILTWVGSTDFYNDEARGQIDGVLAPEQPGSSMKPFLYALALERGYTPASVLPDVPSEFGFEELYVPQNFNNRFSGPVRLRAALASSLNIPAVFLLNKIGLDDYLQKLDQLGFKSLKEKTPGLSLALGGAEVTLYELVQAFSIFARDGNFIKLNSSSENSAQSENAERVFTADTARLICNILSDKNARAPGFGFSKTFETPFSAIFKTGTANQFQNITALGSTPLYTVGVWMGNFDGETVIGKTGSSVPAEIVQKLLIAMQGQNEAGFKKPDTFSRKKICALSGKLATLFCADTIYEYLPDGSGGENSSECTWHTENGANYPAEYQSWFYLKKRNGAIDAGSSALKIVSPRNGSVFFLDPSRSSEQQRLIIEASGGSEETARVILDGDERSEFTITRPWTFSVKIERGTHSVLVICGDEFSKIEYTVR